MPPIFSATASRNAETATLLAGRLIVLARPVGQAASLQAAIAQAGGRTLLFPGLQIVPTAPDEASQAALDALPATDWIIFVSGNAVRAGLPLLPSPWPGHLRAAAVGASTAQTLLDAGLASVLRPADGHSEDSEGLLARPELQNLQGRRVLIVRGMGGRETLANGLRAAGASVAYAELYRRVPVTQDIRPFTTALDAGQVSAICAMSAETIHNLFEQLDSQWHTALCAACWLVPHPRVAAAARDRGIRTLLESAGSSDAAVMHTLITSFGQTEHEHPI